MSLLFTLVRKDIRLLRWPWLGWIGVLLAHIALGVWCITSPRFGNEDLTRTTRLHLTLLIVGHVFAYVLVLRLVQADAPARATAFWRTRPISGSRLLASKALVALLLFIVTPALVWLPWWLVNGFDLPALGLAATDLLLMQIAVLLPAFLIGSVTDSFSRAVLWSIVHYGLVICTPLLVKAPYEQTLDTSLTCSRYALAAGVAALGLPALIVWQFRTRRSATTIAAYAVLFGCVAVIAAYSPYVFKLRASGENEQRPPFADTLTLRLKRARFLSVTHRGAPDDNVWMHTHWELEGLPPDLVVAPLFARGSLTLKGEVIQPGENLAGTNPIPNLRLLDRLGAREVPTPDITPPPAAIYFNHLLTPDQATRLSQQSPALTAHALLRLFRPSLRLDQAATVGYWHADELGGLRITRLEANARQISGDHVFTRADSLLSGFVSWWRMPPAGDRITTHLSEPRTDFLFNPSDGWIEPLSHSGIPVVIGGVGIQRFDRAYIVPSLRHGRPNGPSATESAAWLSKLRLIRLSYREEARTSVSGHAESFVIEDAPKTRASGR